MVLGGLRFACGILVICLVGWELRFRPAASVAVGYGWCRLVFRLTYLLVAWVYGCCLV